MIYYFLRPTPNNLTSLGDCIAYYLFVVFDQATNVIFSAFPFLTLAVSLGTAFICYVVSGVTESQTPRRN